MLKCVFSRHSLDDTLECLFHQIFGPINRFLLMQNLGKALKISLLNHDKFS